MVDMGDYKYIIGGTSLPENLLTNEIWELDTTKVDFGSLEMELTGAYWNKLNFVVKIYCKIWFYVKKLEPQPFAINKGAYSFKGLWYLDICIWRI